MPVGGRAALPSMFRPRTREEWETLIGGKLLNRVGALALILGVGFFLKYAFDKQLVERDGARGPGRSGRPAA